MDKPRNDAEEKEDSHTIREAEKAITDLNDAIISSQEDSKLIIANLKKVVQGDEKRKALLRSNFYPSRLRDDGLTDSEIRNLSRVLSVQGDKVVFENNFHFILSAFNIIELGEHGLHQFMNRLDPCYSMWNEPILNADSIRQIGIMICEVLFYPEVYKLAKKFLNLKSSVEIQTQVLEILKSELLKDRHQELLSDSRLLLVIHMIASCGNRMKDAVPDEIEKLDFGNSEIQLHCTNVFSRDVDGINENESENPIGFDETDTIALTTVMSHCTRVLRLSFQNCGITSSCVKIFRNRLSNSKLKISEINFGWNKGMGVDGLAHVGEVVKQHEVDKLDLNCCGLKGEEVQSFNKGAGDAKISEIVFTLNKDMGVDGLAHVGEVVKQHEVDKLSLMACGLKAEEVQSFNKGAEDAKISEIDFSGNEDMGVDGLSHVGEVVKQHEVDKLSLFCCGLKAEEVQSFNNGAGDAKISKIDFSGNRNMGVDGLSHVGEVVKQHEVDKLSLIGCGLKAEEVQSFNKGAGDAKISEIKFSGNRGMGVDGLAHVGEVVKEHEVDKLSLVDCGLKAEEVQSFNKGAEDAKISEISFRGNKDMGVDALAHVGEVVKQHEVDKLNFGYCGYPEVGLYDHDVTSISEINLSCNPLGSYMGKNVIRQIKRQHKVNKLDIRGCGFSDDERKMLEKEIEESFGPIVEHDFCIEQDVAAQERIAGIHIHKDQVTHIGTTDVKASSSKKAFVENEYETDEHLCLPAGYEESSDHFEIMKTQKAAIESSTKRKSDSDSFFLEQSILSTSTTKDVGVKGATITVGGCSVIFPKECFRETETVKITALLDSSVIPKGKQAVTPILNVCARNMRKSAIVTLNTWCIDEEEQGIGVNVIRYSSSKMEWMDLHHCMLGISGFLQFECDHFCQTVGVTEKDVPLTYSLKPVICTVDRVLNVALMKDANLQMNLFLKAVEQDNRRFKFSNLHHTFNNVTCRKPDTVEIVPEIENDNSTITFKPEELAFDINDVAEDDNPSYNSFSIKGTVRISPIEVEFSIKKNEVIKQRRVVSLDMKIDKSSRTEHDRVKLTVTDRKTLKNDEEASTSKEVSASPSQSAEQGNSVNAFSSLQSTRSSTTDVLAIEPIGKEYQNQNEKDSSRRSNLNFAQDFKRQSISDDHLSSFNQSQSKVPQSESSELEKFLNTRDEKDSTSQHQPALIMNTKNLSIRNENAVYSAKQNGRIETGGNGNVNTLLQTNKETSLLKQIQQSPVVDPILTPLLNQAERANVNAKNSDNDEKVSLMENPTLTSPTIDPKRANVNAIDSDHDEKLPLGENPTLRTSTNDLKGANVSAADSDEKSSLVGHPIMRSPSRASRNIKVDGTDSEDHEDNESSSCKCCICFLINANTVAGGNARINKSDVECSETVTSNPRTH